MIGGLVEISSSDKRHLSVYRGFLQVSEDKSEVGRISLDDITALILSGHQITLSKNLMVELAQRKAVIVTCGKNWHPISFSLPFGVHFEAAGILQDQIAASAPLQKRLWQQVVQAKIINQATVLNRYVSNSDVVTKISALSRKVQSGDPANVEAQAARLYWPALLGSNFKRSRFGGGANTFLNYGYTVLRAAMARSVCGSGLHPALGIHHKGRVNMFALIDDLVEPFRPLVDSMVKCAIADNLSELGPAQKRKIAGVLQEDMLLEENLSPAINCFVRLTQSLSASLANKKPKLVLARIRHPKQEKLF